MITTNLWKEDEGANLRNFHEDDLIIFSILV